MPIKIADGLSAKEKLHEEGIFTIDKGLALHQDIRPLRILILNLMPLKKPTELQLLRLLGDGFRSVGQQVSPHLGELAGMALDWRKILVTTLHGNPVEFVGEETDGVVEILVKIDVGYRVPVRPRVGAQRRDEGSKG